MKVFISSFFAVIIVFCSSIQSQEITADSGFSTKSLSGCKSDLRYLNQVIGWQVKWPRELQKLILLEPDRAKQAMISLWGNLAINSDEPEPIKHNYLYESAQRLLISTEKSVTKKSMFSKLNRQFKEKHSIAKELVTFSGNNTAGEYLLSEQELSYSLGTGVILSEQKRAQHKSGSLFNLAIFHEIIFSSGARL